MNDSLSQPLVALLVEDEPADAELIALQLEEVVQGWGVASIRLDHVASVSAACSALRESTPDVVILDLFLPDSRGLDALHLVRAASPSVPIIVLSGMADQSLALEALRAGAQDYVLKPPPDGYILSRIVRYACERQQLLLKLDAAAQARDRAMSIVSHDLRTPLSTIQMCATALLDPEPATAVGVRHMAELIQRSCAWMQQIVQDLLDRARLDGGLLTLEREPTSVDDLVDATREIFAPMARERAIEFRAESSPNLPHVDADSHRLLQVLSNLVGNALKFTPPGGKVALSAQSAEDDAPEGQSSGAPLGVRFTVSDTGRGIPADEIDHVCDWFWQSPQHGRGGAGLGLAIAKGMIEAHRRRLHIESAAGRGSSFWFTLPSVVVAARIAPQLLMVPT